MEKIIFNVNSTTLYLKGFEDEGVTLSHPAKRLLLLLLSEQGKTLHRETILTKVWDDYGITSTNNNLNQCIYKIRSAFKTLNISTDPIATFPKIGIALSDECDITLIGSDAAIADNTSDALTVMQVEDINGENPQAATEVSQENTAEATSKQAKGPAFSLKNIRAQVFLFPLLVAFTCFYFLFSTKSTASNDHYVEKTLSPCQVLLSHADDVESKYQRDAVDYVKGLNLSCSDNEHYMVVKDNTGKTKDSMFNIYKCRKVEDGQHEVCSAA